MYKDDNLDKYIHAWQERYYYVSSSVTGEVYTSEFNSFSSSSVRAGAVGKIINGGKKIIYTAATAAMLNANLAQYANAFTTNVPDGATSVVTQEVVSSGVQNINSGGTAVSGSVITGGQQNIYNGGSAVAMSVYQGGWQYIRDGAVAVDNLIGLSGRQVISSGGVASGTILESRYASQTVWGGGIVYDTIISGGTQTILSGAVGDNTTIYDGSQDVYGTAKSGLLVSRAWQTIYSGAVANSTVISSGGNQYISSGGTALGNIIYSSGHQVVSAGGQAISTIISSGGVLDLSNYGLTSGVIISSGGIAVVWSGSIDLYPVIEQGGNLHIRPGGISLSVSQNSGGAIGVTVGAGDLYINTYIEGTNHYGEAFKVQSGVGSNFVLNDTGYYIVASGGSALDTTVNSGNMSVQSDGYANSTVLNGGWMAVSGLAENIVINGGSQTISSGAVTSNTIVNSGGSQVVSSAATAIDTTVNSGGLLMLSYYAGLAGETLINSGGSMSGGYISSHNGAIKIDGGLWQDARSSTLDTVILDNGQMRFANTPYFDYPNSISIKKLEASDDSLIAMGVDFADHTRHDTLTIGESYTGNAKIDIFDISYNPVVEITGNGIKLIDFEDNAQISGSLSLLHGQVDNGGYVYKLLQGDLDGLELYDYYLRSEQDFTDTFKTMANIPIMNNMLALTGMNSLQKRLGDLHHFNNTQNKHGIWARTYAKDMTVSDLIDTDMTIFGVEAGYDYLLTPNDDAKLYIGFMGGYADSTRIKTKQANDMYSKGDGEAPSVGLYASLSGESGWFIDLAARHFWTKLDMKNYAAGGSELKYKPKRDITAVSLEAGKAFLTKPTGASQWRIEPKAEFMYMYAGSDKAAVENGTGDLEYDGINYITARAAVTAGYLKERASGLLMEPYIEASYRYEFDGKGDIRYGGADFESDLSGGTFEGALGLDWQLSKDLYAYAQGTYEKGSKLEAFGGNIGIRYGFGGVKKEEKAPSAVTGQFKDEDVRITGAGHISAPLEIGKAVSIDSAAFGYASAELSEEVKAELKEKSKDLEFLNYEKIEISGHSDSTGSDITNNRLSRARAKAVADYLIESGVERHKIEYWGEGSKKPVASNATQEGRAQNRRVEISIK